MTDSIKQIKKPSQRQFVKDWLLSGKPLTQAEAIAMTGNLSIRLAPRIYDLTQEGYPVRNLTRGQVHSDGTNLPAKYMLPQYFLNNVAEFGLLNALQSERAVKALQKEIMV